MATLAELLAARAAGQGTPAPAAPPAAATHPAPETFATPPRAEYLGRQDGTEPLPNNWPPDESDCATGRDIIVVQNPHLESFLALKLPSGKIKYLLGPLQTLNIPF